MDITIANAGSTHVAVIDNFYSEDVVNCIMQELDLMASSKVLQPPEKTFSAVKNKMALKKNNSVFLDDIYANRRKESSILRANRIVFSNNFINCLASSSPIFGMLSTCNYDTTLLSYYEDSDYYLPHKDSAMFTAVTWFYKTPKAFDGGDLVIENNLKIDCVQNRCVIFLSNSLHEVTPVKISQTKENNGRFSLSQFILIDKESNSCH